MRVLGQILIRMFGSLAVLQTIKALLLVGIFGATMFASVTLPDIGLKFAQLPEPMRNAMSVFGINQSMQIVVGAMVTKAAINLAKSWVTRI